MSFDSTSSSQWQNNGLWQQFSPPIVPEQYDGIEELPYIDFEMLEWETAGHNTGQDSGSGSAQAIILETDTPTSVAQQPCKKKNGKGAEYSKRSRDKKKKREQEKDDEIAKLREENEKYRRYCQKYMGYILYLQQKLTRREAEIDILTQEANEPLG